MSSVSVGNPMVLTGEYEGGGLSPKQLAKIAVNRTMTISETAHPAVQDQVQQFKYKLENVLLVCFERMAESERLRIAERMRDGGHVEIAGAIMRI